MPALHESGPRQSGSIALLFLHFFGSSQREWHHVVQRMSNRYRCVTADMPGFGDAAAVEGYTVQRMSEYVRALLDHLSPSPVILVGHSMSGKVSMVVANQPPANLAGLVLVAPSPLLPEPMTEEASATMAVANTSQAKAAEFVRGGHALPISKDDEQFAIADVLRANPDAWKAWPESGAREDWSMSVRRIALPSLLVAGELDRAIPLDFQRKHTAPLLADGRMHVIAGAAHLLPFEAPEELATAIGGFVEELETKRTLPSSGNAH